MIIVVRFPFERQHRRGDAVAVRAAGGGGAAAARHRDAAAAGPARQQAARERRAAGHRYPAWRHADPAGVKTYSGVTPCSAVICLPDADHSFQQTDVYCWT